MLVKSQCLLVKKSPILSVKSHLFGLNEYVLDGEIHVIDGHFHIFDGWSSVCYSIVSLEFFFDEKKAGEALIFWTRIMAVALVTPGFRAPTVPW